MGRGGQTGDEIFDIGFEFGKKAALELALLARAERVEPRAAQELETRHDAESGHRPRARLALGHDPGRRIGAGERPGADMKMQPVRAFELARQRLPEFRSGEQARDFPLVLGGEKLVVGAGDRESQRLAQAGVSFGRARSLDQRAVALRVSRIAIFGQMRGAAVDERVE